MQGRRRATDDDNKTCDSKQQLRPFHAVLVAHHDLSEKSLGTHEAFNSAHRLYERFAFRYCGPFAEHVDGPHNVYVTMEVRDVGMSEVQSGQ